MFRVLLVEDEPAALRYLRTIIERKCPGFSVAATATNGREALSLVDAAMPDLVVTDVKMSVMDGLELVTALKAGAPETPVVIVSGYQEFEFARRALNTGVVDYLPKPVSPRRLAEVFDEVRGTLERNSAARAIRIARALLAPSVGAPPEPVPEPPSGSVANSRYRLAVHRRGAPPSRYTVAAGGAAVDHRAGALTALRGRDAEERLFLAAEEELSHDEFVRAVTEEAATAAERYGTLLFARGGLLASELRDECDALLRELDSAIVLGATQTLEAAPPPRRFAEIDPVLEGRVEHAITNLGRDALEAAVRDTVRGWEAEHRIFGALLSAARTVVRIARAHSAREASGLELDDRVEKLLVAAKDYAEAADSLSRLAVEAAGLDSELARAPNVPALFDEIRRFVETSFAQPLTIQSTCERFRISPTYLSRLFRRFSDSSFNEYVKLQRMEAARRLIRESPAMPMKNIARCVGFQDEFYFSRVFKAVTGRAPTEYAKSEAARVAEPEAPARRDG